MDFRRRILGFTHKDAVRSLGNVLLIAMALSLGLYTAFVDLPQRAPGPEQFALRADAPNVALLDEHTPTATSTSTLTPTSTPTSTSTPTPLTLDSGPLDFNCVGGEGVGDPITCTGQSVPDNRNNQVVVRISARHQDKRLLAIRLPLSKSALATLPAPDASCALSRLYANFIIVDADTGMLVTDFENKGKVVIEVPYTKGNVLDTGRRTKDDLKLALFEPAKEGTPTPGAWRCQPDSDIIRVGNDDGGVLRLELDKGGDPPIAGGP